MHQNQDKDSGVHNGHSQLQIVLTKVGNIQFEALNRGNWFNINSNPYFTSPRSNVTLDETVWVPLRSSAGHDFIVTAVNPYIGYPRIEIHDNKTGREDFHRFSVGESFKFNTLVDGLRLSGWREGDDDRNDQKLLRLRIELDK